VLDFIGVKGVHFDARTSTLRGPGGWERIMSDETKHTGHGARTADRVTDWTSVVLGLERGWIRACMLDDSCTIPPLQRSE